MDEAKQLPALPEGYRRHPGESVVFTANQMQAYGDARVAAALAAHQPSAAEPVAQWDDGVYKGAEGMRGLAECDGFWAGVPYGTRLYFGCGSDEYLHRDALRAAVKHLSAPAAAAPPVAVPVPVLEEIFLRAGREGANADLKHPLRWVWEACREALKDAPEPAMRSAGWLFMDDDARGPFYCGTKPGSYLNEWEVFERAPSDGHVCDRSWAYGVCPHCEKLAAAVAPAAARGDAAEGV